jgi:hypothetical protein
LPLPNLLQLLLLLPFQLSDLLVRFATLPQAILKLELEVMLKMGRDPVTVLVSGGAVDEDILLEVLEAGGHKGVIGENGHWLARLQLANCPSPALLAEFACCVKLSI